MSPLNRNHVITTVTAKPQIAKGANYHEMHEMTSSIAKQLCMAQALALHLLNDHQ